MLVVSKAAKTTNGLMTVDLVKFKNTLLLRADEFSLGEALAVL